MPRLALVEGGRRGEVDLTRTVSERDNSMGAVVPPFSVPNWRMRRTQVRKVKESPRKGGGRLFAWHPNLKPCQLEAMHTNLCIHLRHP